jgi:hypothetical protein
MIKLSEESVIPIPFPFPDYSGPRERRVVSFLTIPMSSTRNPKAAASCRTLKAAGDTSTKTLTLVA